MLTIEQINSTRENVVETMRKNKQRRESGLPEYHSTYTHSVEMKEAIEIHAVMGKKPDTLLKARYPNQTPQEYDYGLGNYQQTTIPVFLDTVHTMQRSFSDTNWSIDYRQGEDEQNDLKQYLEVDIKRTSLSMGYFDYMFNVAASLKLIDAMGCIGYKPDYIPTIETEEGAVIDGSVRFDIIPQYYPCEAIVAYETGKWYMFLSEDKSMVEWGNTTVQEGLIFEVYDDTHIYKIVQVGKKVDYTFETFVYFTHNCGYCPVDRLKGIPGVMGKEVIYQSPFLFATPCLNDVILDSIMLRSVKAASVFPYRVMTGNICENTMNINGEIQNCNGTGWFRDLTTQQPIVCGSCMGTGMKDRISPHGVLLLRPETAFKEGELKSSQPAMYYVEPSVDTPAFLRSEIDNNTDKARAILHLRTMNQQAKGTADETATGAMIDEKALISVVKTFRDQLAASTEFGVKTIGLMREGDGVELPVFTWSNSFDFLTEFEYMQKISDAIKNGMPSFVVYAAVYQYITTVFYDDSTRAQIFDLLISTDRLLVMPYEQINIESAKGQVASWEVVLHDSGITLIKQLISDQPGFLDLDFKAQQEQLITAAKTLADANKVAMPTSGKSVVEQVMNASNGSVN